ncbi:MAG: phosphoglucosamine mutase, partial [Verrucomicrobia bacterium RIFCSPLOWO2_12_FULL_64_8]
MNRRYFGTDGVRGPYGGPVVNESFARSLGAAAGRWLKDVKWSTPPWAREAESDRLHVLIGRDTRESGPVLEAALAAGLMSEGWAPVSLGVVPTPAVSLGVRRGRAAFGAMVTASHNPAIDNGIKFFGSSGRKLSDEEEFQIEQRLKGSTASVEAFARLPVRKVDGAAGDYIETVRKLLPFGALAGWRIVVDTAHGAATGTSPEVLRMLGAEIIGLGNAPDGRNINAGVGSEHPEAMCARVRSEGARLGVAHDGDGDRCMLCDEHGDLLDGDEILTLLAVHALRRGALAGNTLVVTVQSNLGVDAAVAAAGGRVVRTAVGDRYVIERMYADGVRLGGESSGHIVCTDVAPTGDGLVAALKVMEIMVDTG